MTQVRTCVAIICFDDDGRFLAVRRAKPPLMGMWTLPGGGVEFGESIHNAVLRELGEETGLLPTSVRRVGLHEFISSEYHFVTLLFATNDFSGTARAGDDVDDIAWMTLKEAEERFSAIEMITLAASLASS